MSRFPMARLAKRSKSSSVSTRRILVSEHIGYDLLLELMISDVIVLTSMGEEVAIEAKEAPRGS